MANHIRNGTRPQTLGPPPAAAHQTTAGLPLVDHAKPSGVTYEYDIPGDTEDNLHEERTADFGSLRMVIVRLLTPLMERAAAKASNNDAISLSAELAKRSIVGIVNDAGTQINVHEHDGSTDMLWAQVHPKIRSMVVNAYADNNVPNGRSTESFIKSRRVRA